MLESTPDHILDSTEQLLSKALSVDEVSVRKIARHAGVNISAVNYHFGSRDKLFAAVMHRVYRKFNTERLNQLQRAIWETAPDPPKLEAVIAALIEPSIRWSADPASAYAIFNHFTVVVRSTHDEEIRDTSSYAIEHLQSFVKAFKRAAPWLSDGEIGWRIHCALGIRHIALRDRVRGRILVGDAFDTDDQQQMLAQMIAVIAPMFRR